MAHDVQERIVEVKRELKKFENGFKARHGRHPTRDEVKSDAKIHGLYSEYKSLQRQSLRPQQNAKQDDGTALKERSTNLVSATPQKRSKTMDQLAIPEPPLPVQQTPACVRSALGPTPQKDGEVLGIFDMLPTATPSRRTNKTQDGIISFIGATPSKPTASASEPSLSKTPQSPGKRFYLEAFQGTPLKRKAPDELHTPSTAKRHDATPSFLRGRILSLPTLHEDDGDFAVTRPLFKKRQFERVRSLSTLCQALDTDEQERMDENWDIMDEIEADTRGEVVAPKVLAEDSQAAEMPLGPDKGVESEEDEDVDPGALDANGNPRKVWKKKGLKRQTRRTNMRPVMHKPKKAVQMEESDGEGSVVDIVRETQLLEGEGDHASEDDAESGEERNDSQQSTTTKKKGGKNKNDDTNTKDKAKKKVAPSAHANFRRLKIKSKNSKANGRGRKFGRR